MIAALSLIAGQTHPGEVAGLTRLRGNLFQMFCFIASNVLFDQECPVAYSKVKIRSLPPKRKLAATAAREDVVQVLTTAKPLANSTLNRCHQLAGKDRYWGRTPRLTKANN